ncbi:amidohydrolase family protein [Flavisphingomonas formosensis]|uniref:amidohydrolase family protein n=1 Tax=Flavisphingomonas formosensis TaxID=861534 RepID=UPI0018DF1524|nr:amidohydrolase family protein [Sphingomonas formosensis]
MNDHTCASTAPRTPDAGADLVRPMPVIDVHCHIATPAVEKLVAGHPARDAEMTTTHVLQGGPSTEYNRTVMLPACVRRMTDLPGRIADMDAMGVDVQILSPSPGQYYYWAEPDLADRIVALQNEHIARTVTDHPDRFRGLAAVSLQHPDLAVRQLTHAVRNLGLRGVEISSTDGTRELGDPSFEPFWAKAEELGAVVFIHPLGSSLGARLDRHYLANVIGQPIETTIALSHLIFGGVLDRYTGLKIVAAHGGGYLPTYPDRSDHAWGARPDSHSMAEPLTSYLKRIWFDNLVYTPQAIRALIDRVGVERLVVGTDFPFDMGAYDVQAVVERVAGLSSAEREAILGGNALALFGLDEAGLHNARSHAGRTCGSTS